MLETPPQAMSKKHLDAGGSESLYLSRGKSRPVVRFLRRLMLALGISGLVGFSVVLARLVRTELIPALSDEGFAGNIEILLMININIAILMVLGFLVLKNIFRLILDRRKNTVGSKLRSRLVAAFFLLSLIPTALLFFVAKGILDSVLKDWFSPQIGASIDNTKKIVELHYDEQVNDLRVVGDALGEKFGAAIPLLASIDPNTGKLSFDEEETKKYLDEIRVIFGLDEFAIFERSGKVLYASSSRYFWADGGEEDLKASVYEPNMVRLAGAFSGEQFVSPEKFFDRELLRLYQPLSIKGKDRLLLNLKIDNSSSDFRLNGNVGDSYVLVISKVMSVALSNALSEAINSYDEYKELRTYRQPIASSYLLTLLIVTLVVVFAAIWVGFYIARTITGPIMQLVDGTRKIATGKLAHRIPESGDDEISFLVRCFNAMAGDLESSTAENIERRQYMEAVLAHVGVGLLAIDSKDRITTINLTAKEVLNFEAESEVEGLWFSRIPNKDLYYELEGLLVRLAKKEESSMTKTIVLAEAESERHIRVTVSKLYDATGNRAGAVLLLDDMSALVGAERMAAWREVARRIAHEIKNPLTPIQLSAQRIQRKFATDQESKPEKLKALVNESTTTIVNQVQLLRNLVTEFSKFARLPQCKPSPTDLNFLIQEVVALYREAHPEMQFNLHMETNFPIVDADEDQMRRVIVNLLDNAVFSVKMYRRQNCDTDTGSSQVSVRTSFDEHLSCVTIEIIDTGIGVAEENIGRIFEPYFSTKKKGTGLGLSMVSAIVTDHGGTISVKKNKHHGAIFSIELPYTIKKEVIGE